MVTQDSSWCQVYFRDVNTGSKRVLRFLFMPGVSNLSWEIWSWVVTSQFRCEHIRDTLSKHLWSGYSDTIWKRSEKHVATFFENPESRATCEGPLTPLKGFHCVDLRVLAVTTLTQHNVMTFQMAKIVYCSGSPCSAWIYVAPSWLCSLYLSLTPTQTHWRQTHLYTDIESN